MRVFQKIILLCCCLFALTTCQSEPTPSPPTPQPEAEAALPTAAPLVPTFTPMGNNAAPASNNTPTPRPVEPTSTPIDFTQPVLTIRYQIPAVGLDRVFAGSLNSSIQLTDITSGEQITLGNQPRALLELQNVLETIALEPLPDDCERCVVFTYDLPLEGRTETGWLQDEILLASVEFFFANNLRPHFPPNTVAGLHRAASGYTVAHTTALLEDGMMWRWAATDTEIPEPETAPQAVIDTLTALPVNVLEELYFVECPFFPAETLYIRTESAAKTMVIGCPELSLPTTLSAGYAAIGQLADESLDPEQNIPFPEQLLPFEGLLFYQRTDGATLTIYQDGTQVAIDAAGEPVTSTVQLEPLQALTRQMVSSDVLARGVAIANDPEAYAETESLLLIRAELGVYELGWAETIGQGLLPPIIELDTILVEQVGFIGDVVAPTPTPTLEATPAITGTTTMTPTVMITATVPVTVTTSP